MSTAVQMVLLLYTHPDRKDILGFHSLCVCLCTVRVGVHGSCTRVEGREQPCLLPCLKLTPGYLAFSSLGSIPHLTSEALLRWQTHSRGYGGS